MPDNKLPAFQFYPADWRKDPSVQLLSYHDKGIWFEMLCLMHESPERGKLVMHNGEAIPEEGLARLLGLDNQTLNQSLTTLLAYGVAKQEPETKVIFNKRMVNDEKLRQIRKEAGKLGGNPQLKKKKVKQKTTTKVKQSPTPSSSSSSSSSASSSKGKCTLNEILDFCMEIGVSKIDGEALFHKWEGSGWMNGKNPIKDWKATIRSWRKQGYLPTQNNPSLIKAETSLIDEAIEKRQKERERFAKELEEDHGTGK